MMILRRNRYRLLLAALALVGLYACNAWRSHQDPAGATRSSTVPTTAPATAPSGAVLTVTINGLRNQKGDLIFGVFTQPDGFPNVQSKSFYWEVKPADAGAGGANADASNAVTFTMRLPPGRYAAGVLHDENRNGDMDKGIGGIPLEGYGVTNNPKPRLRKATFDEATFTLPPEGAAMTISLQYF
jgi:uncharacterized protein (DUF2141 family)